MNSRINKRTSTRCFKLCVVTMQNDHWWDSECQRLSTYRPPNTVGQQLLADVEAIS